MPKSLEELLVGLCRLIRHRREPLRVLVVRARIQPAVELD
jgi:hypothetical protein